MEPNGHDTDDVTALRSRVDELEERWRSAEGRLAAFARLEQLAEAQATTPEALASRAALARSEARLGELRSEAEALESTVADLGTEVARLDEERDHAERRLEQVTADLDRRTADLEAVEREVTALLVTRAERAAEVDELTRSRDELCAEIAEFLDGLEELRAVDGGELALRPASPADLLAGATPPDYEDDGDSAFAQFFGTDFEHDKSRDWILSEADGSGSAGGS